MYISLIRTFNKEALDMIRVGGEEISQGTAFELSNDNVKRIAFNILNQSTKVYTYQSIDALKFELDLRSYIVKSAIQLNSSHFEFAVFKKSRCNEEYWIRTQEGGFELRRGKSAYRAIMDILENSRAYATECATAIVIVFYLALTNMFSEDLFNRLFGNMYLMDWQYLDKDLGIQSYRNVKDYLPGDCLYFQNPDYDPKTPEWRGENVIKLSENRYYGHGVGIKTADGIIEELNRNRFRGATNSAYLTDRVIRPDFRYLYKQWMQST